MNVCAMTIAMGVKDVAICNCILQDDHLFIGYNSCFCDWNSEKVFSIQAGDDRMMLHKDSTYVGEFLCKAIFDSNHCLLFGDLKSITFGSTMKIIGSCVVELLSPDHMDEKDFHNIQLQFKRYERLKAFL